MTDTAQGSVTVTFSDDQRVATILIDRPDKLNALTLDMLGQLEHCCTAIGQSTARVVLVRSAGSRVFCVGADITHFENLDAAAMWQTWVASGHRAFAAVAALRQPTIAVVDGLAVGGGFELALACDFRVLSADARVGLPEAGLGTVPGWGGTERLTQLVGRARAKDVALTRRLVSADECLQWGIASRVAPAAELDSAVDDVTVAILGSAPIAAQLVKQIINAAADGAPSSVLESISAAFVSNTSDLQEGIAAFHEKRVPHFTGA